MLWYCATQANIAQKVCVNFVLLLECRKRQELSFLVYDASQGLYASIIPLLMKNKLAADSDFMFIPQISFSISFFVLALCLDMLSQALRTSR